MKTITQILSETSTFSNADFKVLEQSKISFDTSIDNLAMGKLGDFNIIINGSFRGGDYEANISKGSMEDHVATINDKTLKKLMNQVEKKVK